MKKTVLILLFLPGILLADGMNSPPSAKKPHIIDYYPTNNIRWVTTRFIHFFSEVISPADGPRSPSYPTGSAYGYKALEKHGFFIGIILTADRLIHESDVHQGPYIMKHDQKRYFDPLYWNTFWWFPDQN